MFGRDSTGFIKPLFEQRDSEKLFRNNKAVFEELTVQKKDGKRTFFYQNRQYLFHLQNQFSPIFFHSFHAIGQMAFFLPDSSSSGNGQREITFFVATLGRKWPKSLGDL